MTIAEQIRQDSLKKGIQRGMKKGRLAGIQEGEATILLRQLGRKFGPIPPQYLQQIEQADADTLLIWSDKILDADTLHEVFH